MVYSALVFRSSGEGSSPGGGHCVVFLGKTFSSHSTSLHPGVQMHAHLVLLARFWPHIYFLDKLKWGLQVVQVVYYPNMSGI